MKLIDKIVEPKRVLVIWQAPDTVLKQATGTRFVVGEIINHDGNTKLRYFDNQEVKAALNLGFTGLTAYPYDPARGFNGNLMDVLSKRLPPSDRTDYADYLRSYRISNAQGISPLALLAYTSGKLAGDGFTFSHTFEDAAPPFQFNFEIAGFRHNGLKAFPNFTTLQDVTVDFRDDGSNPHDKDAMAIEYQGKVLGYVPKGINCTLRKLISQHQIIATIEKINGTAERPNIMVFVEVK